MSEEPTSSLPSISTTHKPQLTAVNQALQISNFLPANQNFENYSNVPEFNQFKTQTSHKIINLMNKILIQSPAKNKFINPKNINKLNQNTVDEFLENISETNNNFHSYSVWLD